MNKKSYIAPALDVNDMELTTLMQSSTGGQSTPSPTNAVSQQGNSVVDTNNPAEDGSISLAKQATTIFTME